MPAEGRSKRNAPTWPLSRKPLDAERTLWQRLWKLPQAVMWERLNLQPQVASYAITFVASTYETTASLKAVVLRMETELGISANGMNQLRWRIADDELADRRTAKPAVQTELEAPRSARARLHALG